MTSARAAADHEPSNAAAALDEAILCSMLTDRKSMQMRHDADRRHTAHGTRHSALGPGKRHGLSFTRVRRVRFWTIILICSADLGAKYARVSSLENRFGLCAADMPRYTADCRPSGGTPSFYRGLIQWRTSFPETTSKQLGTICINSAPSSSRSFPAPKKWGTKTWRPKKAEQSQLTISAANSETR